MKMTRRNFLSASALTLLSCQLAPAARADCLLSGLFHGADTALPPKPLTAKVVDANPFMGRSESNIHHDCYNTDSTDAVLPVGICPEVNVAMEKTNPNASPAIFFDNFDNPVSPFLGGLAIRDLDAEEVRTIGFFSPARHDGGGYLIQSSYSFVDGRNLIVCPTSHNHVLMLRATDEKGTPLPVFEKVLDINIKEAAERVLGRSLEQNLLSIVFDYDGNLWFVTGGFRIYPSRGQQGAMGYISHNAIDAILAGGTADLDHEVHVYAPAPGEGAENGIASCREGAVILTNLACYLLRANGGVEVVWRTPYDSVGAKDSREGAATTGGGLAWGGGCSPSLSKELVFFTDNLETVSLMAVDIRTGEVAASHPVIDELPANMPVSVENSAIVYDHGNGRVSTIVCNWFGAGSPNLAKPDSDSSIQSYENIYDRNWLLKGNCMIMPGVERVDTIRTADGWTMKSIWCRDDLSDTSMMSSPLPPATSTASYRTWTAACGSTSCWTSTPERPSSLWTSPPSTATTTWPSACTRAVTATSSTAPPATKSCSACRTASSSCPRCPTAKSIWTRPPAGCFRRQSSRPQAAPAPPPAGSTPPPSTTSTPRRLFLSASTA